MADPAGRTECEQADGQLLVPRRGHADHRVHTRRPARQHTPADEVVEPAPGDPDVVELVTTDDAVLRRGQGGDRVGADRSHVAMGVATGPERNLDPLWSRSSVEVSRIARPKRAGWSVR